MQKNNVIQNVKAILKKEGVVEIPGIALGEIGIGQLVEMKELASHSYSCAEAMVPSAVEEFIMKVAGKRPKKWELQVFGHRDFSIINDKKKDFGSFDAIIDITPMWNQSWGGLVHYVDGNGSYTRISPGKNKFTIVRKKGLKRFVQYVNHHANGKRAFLISSF